MYIYTGLGQVGSSEEIKQATDKHAQMLASGVFIKTKYLGQGTNEYHFMSLNSFNSIVSYSQVYYISQAPFRPPMDIP